MPRRRGRERPRAGLSEWLLLAGCVPGGEGRPQGGPSLGSGVPGPWDTRTWHSGRAAARGSPVANPEGRWEAEGHPRQKGIRSRKKTVCSGNF